MILRIKRAHVAMASLGLLLVRPLLAPVHARVADVNALIDPAIQGKNRAVIAKVMKTLDPRDRQNVTFIDRYGKIYANKVTLKLNVNRPKKIKGNLYQDENGRRFAVPGFTPRPTEFSGEKHRVPHVIKVSRPRSLRKLPVIAVIRQMRYGTRVRGYGTISPGLYS